MLYFDTGVTPKINFPQYMSYGMMDGEEFDFYNSTNRELIPTTQWMKKLYDDYPDYKKSEIDILHDTEEIYKVSILTLMGIFNQTEGISLLINPKYLLFTLTTSNSLTHMFEYSPTFNHSIIESSNTQNFY